MMRRIFEIYRGISNIDGFYIPFGLEEVEMYPLMNEEEFTILEMGKDWRKGWMETGEEERFIIPFVEKGGDWRSYYEKLSKESCDYHMVFVNFLYSGGPTVFSAFRSKSLDRLDGIIEELIGPHGMDGREISWGNVDVSVREPSGWEYASYKSEAEQIRTRIARLTERLIEVGEKMRGMERGE